MFTRIRRWLAPPVFQDDEDRTSAAAMLNTLSLIVVTVAILFVVGNLIFVQGMDPLVTGIIVVLLAVCAGSLVLLRLGYVRMVGVTLSAVLWAGFTLPAVNFGGMHDTAIAGYFAVILLAGIAAGGSGLLLFTLLSVASVGAIFAAEHMGFIEAQITPPSGYSDLILLVLLLGTSAVLLRYALRRIETAYGRARRTALALAESNTELEQNRDALAAQTRELERRSRYVEATAAVARDTTLELDIRDLLPRLVSLVSKQLGFYHTGIFFLEPGGEWLTLEAASSEGGRRMVARGHRLRLGVGIVGYAVERREPRIALDVGQDAVFFDNPDLPETRSEMALPLRARGEVIGALDVQSTEPEAFGEEDVAVLQTLADQVALAISNAQLFQQAQESLQAERRAYGELSRQAWLEMVRAQPDLAVLRDEQGLSSASAWLDTEVEQALQTGQSATSSDGGTNLAVPVRVRGQIVGAIDAHKPAGARGWTAAQVVLLETLAGQLGDALEDARLYQEAQRRAAREQLVGEVTTRMRETLDMDAVLQTAVQQMRQALRLHDVTIRLGSEDSPGQVG